MEMEMQREMEMAEKEIETNSGSDSEMEQVSGSAEKAVYFWEEIMERDRQRRNSDRNMNDFMCIKSDSYGQEIYFQKRLLEEAGHALVAIPMDPPGFRKGRLRSSKWEAHRLAEAFRCTLVDYDDVLSCVDNLDTDDDAHFSILVQIAASQLLLSHSVVIRAPLPERAQIDSLLNIVDSTRAKLVVIELRKKKWVNKDTSSSYNLEDVPKLVLPDSTAFGYDEEDDLLDFILLATGMNHWHITDRDESAVEDSNRAAKVEIRHFSHRHPLTLNEQKTSRDSSPPTQYYCDCCMEPISGSDHQYYFCDHCNFSLHKLCAELPQCWDASFHIHPLRLMILGYESDQKSRIVAFWGRDGTQPQISCIVCQGTRRGPIYRCWKCYAFFVHHECALPLTKDLKHECHAHPLNVHTRPRVKKFSCYACGALGESISYRCSECPSDFHLQCALRLALTPSVQHKCHWDPLVLTSTPPKDDTNEYYCEVCTNPRHADHWIYYCEKCEYEAHPHCVNPDIPQYTMPENTESSKQSSGESADDEASEEEADDDASEEEAEWTSKEGHLAKSSEFVWDDEEEAELTSEEGSMAESPN